MLDWIVRCKYDELVDPKTLKANPKNRNAHPPDQIKRLAQILEYQGFRYPIKVSKASGFVTSGHGRILAALESGQRLVPVNYQEYESPEQEYADVVADNSIASWADLDFSGINTDLADLGPDFDIDLLGIKDFTLDPEKLMPQCDEDEMPDQVPAISVLGDLYELGGHRLICADSTSIDAVDRLMNGEKADMVFTDPPYGVGFNYNEHNDEGGDRYAEFIKEVWQVMQTLGCPIVLTPGNKNLGLWLSLADFNLACWVKKNAMSPSAISHLNIFEVILLWGVKERRSTDLLEYSVKQQDGVGDHPCPKLLAVVEDAIESWGPNAKVLFEPFGGAGTTLVACEKSNRRCFALEIDPHYVDTIVSRYVKFTGNNKIKRNGDPMEWSLSG